MSTHPKNYRHPTFLTEPDALALARRCIRARVGFIAVDVGLAEWEVGCAKRNKDAFIELLKPEKDLIG